MIKQQNKKPFTENTIVEWFLGLASALQYLHKANIFHNDLTPRNIFLTRDKRLVLDYLGFEDVLSEVRKTMSLRMEYPKYIAPEQIEAKSRDHRSNLWSLGVILYEICALSYPFNDDSLDELYESIRNWEYKNLNNYSEALNKLINSLLQANPEDRISLHELLQTLEFISLDKNRSSLLIDQKHLDHK